MTEISTSVSNYFRISSRPQNSIGLRWSFYSDEARTQALSLSGKTFRWFLMDENFSVIDSKEPTPVSNRIEVKYEKDDPLLKQTDYFFRLEVTENSDKADYSHGLWSFSNNLDAGANPFTAQTDFAISLPGGAVYCRVQPFLL